MKTSGLARTAATLTLLLLFVPGSSANALELQKYDGGFFSLLKPAGWEIITAGSCAQFAFLIQDPDRPLRQVFYFGEVGPVYMSDVQKQIDLHYMSMGGYTVQWIDMPVVDPLTPENFVSKWHLIAGSSIAQAFMPECPRLENLKVISATEAPRMVSVGETGLVRALFTRDGELGEGLFLLTVVPLLPYAAAPGGGLGYGFVVMGIAGPQSEFPVIESDLVRCLESFNMGQSYVDDCLARQAQQFAGLLKAGKILSDASDIITDGWENRSRTYDIISEKMGDSIMGKERLYDPDTGNVYEFDVGFYDKYSLDQNKYEMNNLTPLPGDDYSLWTAAPLDGYKHLR
jgi:hypothetical protein